MPNFKNAMANKMPVNTSTAGYWIEILLLHEEHRPFKKRKLKTGMSSYQTSVFPHEKHFDLPLMKERPVL